MARQADDPVTPGTTRFEYVGPFAGGVSYTNPQTGRTYVGGNNSRDKFIDVYKEDVDYIQARGVFKLIEIPASETMTVAEKEALTPRDPKANTTLEDLDLPPDPDAEPAQEQAAVEPVAEQPAQEEAVVDPEPVQDQAAQEQPVQEKTSKSKK
ncbi:MAG: hypothetical protein J0I20_34005 [Chloroflexi bacterium]|nr:hypothetical protein [Chloroflexota bacterium]OJW05590.1 MAG: hypothetical protein BGO39_02955 [Chloroflexi bacterium 54-19]